MKKTLITFIFILIGLYAILSLLDHQGQYAFEERIWKANKKLLQLAKDPSVVPEKNFENLAKEYEKIIKNFPSYPLRPRAQMLLVQVYITKKDYSSARTTLKEIINQYSDKNNLQADAYFAIGKTYEFQDNWEEAKKNYQTIIQKYPTTHTGLTMPLYIASYYKAQRNTTKTVEAYTEASLHYQRIASQYPKTETEFRCLKFLANSYFLQNKWKEGLDVLGDILLKYPDRRKASQTIQTINTIAIIQLKDFNVPIQIYKEILEKDPHHPLNNDLQKMINGFTDLKKKNVQIKTKDEL